MKPFITSTLAALVLLLTSGYAQSQNFTFDQLQVVNNSSNVLQDVTVTFPDGEKTLACGDIIALGLCSDRFPRRRYQSSPMVIDWSFGGGERRSDEIEISVPAYVSGGIALYAVIEVSEEGELNGYMVPNNPR